MSIWQISVRAVNHRGHTIGIQVTVNAPSSTAAVKQARQQASDDGYSHMFLHCVREVRHVQPVRK